MMKIASNNPELKHKDDLIATSIKGVGEKTALAIFEEMPDVRCLKIQGSTLLLLSHFHSGGC